MYLNVKKIFVILSVIGGLINQGLIYVGTEMVYNNVTWLQQLMGENLAYTSTKVMATAIVMVYNFITRKIFLEKK